MEKVSLADKFSLVGDYWNPRIVAEFDDCYVKVAKLKGEFVWHSHRAEDEMFLVVEGRLSIRLRDGDILLEKGELVVIPRGVEHLPAVGDAGEAHVVLIEPKTTLNTGNAESERTVRELGWI